MEPELADTPDPHFPQTNPPPHQPMPTLSLYLVGAGLRAPEVPEVPRPCFRSCTVTNWLAVVGEWVLTRCPHPALLSCVCVCGSITYQVSSL